MKRKRLFIVGIIVLCAVFLYVGGVVSAPAALSNPIDNPSFEGTYIEWSQRINLAPGYRLVYWRGEPLLVGGSRGTSSQPECKPILASQFPYRVHSGDKAQCCFWFSWHGDAALYEIVQAQAGTVQARAWFHTWSGNDDNNPHEAGEMYVSIGIDPEGRDPQQGGWPWETSVVWSPFRRATADYRQYASLPVIVGRDGPITVYVRFYSKWDEKHGDAYIDDVDLVYIEQGAQPTYTPYPTPAPCPTCAPGGACDYDAIRGIIREELDSTTWQSSR